MASGNFDPEAVAGTDNVIAHGFNSRAVSGTAVFDDSGPEHVPIHFTTAAARDAFAAALDSASTAAQRNAVIQNYVAHTVGGYWGSMGDVL